MSHNNEVTGTKIDGSSRRHHATEQLPSNVIAGDTAEHPRQAGSELRISLGAYNNVVTEIKHNYYHSSRGVERGYQSRTTLADRIHGMRVQNITSPWQPSNNVPPMSFADFKDGLTSQSSTTCG